ncbi:MAG TPA: ATP-binding protein, partial [Flavisolibacter sp.]|nr:ATP-binding protein [Flavisolibacter sp.]
LSILVFFIITTYINFQQSKVLRRNTEFLSQSSMIIRQSNRLQRNILYMERVLRGFLLTGQPDFIQSYELAIADNDALFNELHTLISDTSIQHEYLNKIKEIYTQWINDYAAPLQVLKQQNFDSARSNIVFQQLYRKERLVREEEIINQQLGAEFTKLYNQEYKNRDVRKIILEDSEKTTKNISLFLTALSVFVGLLIALILTRYISIRITKMVNLANTIAQGNYDVSINDKRNDELSKLSVSLNHMAQMLDHNIKQLKRSNDELDKFAHIVSHDMKAPLRGISNIVSWIEEDHYDELSPKVKEYFDLIKGRLNRSENLIQGILSYARINKDVEHQEEVNVNHLVKDAIENTPVDKKLQIHIDDQLPVIFSEKIPLLQVFSNLLSNAVKYHDKEDGFIKIFHKDHGSHYEFFVEDNGPGIASHYHHKIFIIFQTLQERDSFESTGVGLAIVKKILDDRKEKINLISEPGKGTLFSFTWSK